MYINKPIRIKRTNRVLVIIPLSLTLCFVAICISDRALNKSYRTANAESSHFFPIRCLTSNTSSSQDKPSKSEGGLPSAESSSEELSRVARLHLRMKPDCMLHVESEGLLDPCPVLRVLVVEDSLPIQRVMQRWLHSLGCHVTLAENGRVGLNLLKEHQFEVVFSDFLMVR